MIIVTTKDAIIPDPPPLAPTRKHASSRISGRSLRSSVRSSHSLDAFAHIIQQYACNSQARECHDYDKRQRLLNEMTSREQITFERGFSAVLV